MLCSSSGIISYSAKPSTGISKSSSVTVAVSSSSTESGTASPPTWQNALPSSIVISGIYSLSYSSVKAFSCAENSSSEISGVLLAAYTVIGRPAITTHMDNISEMTFFTNNTPFKISF
ncbi:unknown [Clostridium sp. CAG:678]|nr:unknown [Clostridium sp. CAG:678]